MIRKSGIILAADVEDLSSLLSLVMEVADYIDGIKIGNGPLYQHGWRIIREVKQAANLPIIADLKLMDVPFIAEQLAKRAYENGADGIMVCGSAGMDSIGFCRAVFPGLVIVVTQFTHCRQTIPDVIADRSVELAKSLGCDGVQVPATFSDRVSHVREVVGEGLTLFACGIGRQGAAVGSAIASGADFEIIGREISEPRHEFRRPREAARHCMEMIRRRTRANGIDDEHVVEFGTPHSYGHRGMILGDPSEDVTTALT